MTLAKSIEQVYDSGQQASVVTPPEEDVDMAEQLNLETGTAPVDPRGQWPSANRQRRAWQMDEHTREVGRRGIASARAALAAHRPTDEVRRHAA